LFQNATITSSSSVATLDGFAAGHAPNWCERRIVASTSPLPMSEAGAGPAR
jgi:hypothetical protein